MTARYATSKFICNFAICVAMALFAGATAEAQNNNDFLRFRSVVGGVSIDPNGVLTDKATELAPTLREQLLNGWIPHCEAPN